MELEKLSQQIQALIFTTESSISLDEIKESLELTFETKFENSEVEDALGDVIKHFENEKYAFEIVEISGGYKMLTKAAFHPVVSSYLKLTIKRRLSRAALETLSVIAYRQPVAKSEMEKIRGVSCDYSVQKLLEKELVSIVGRSEGPGRPLLYGTSLKFMDYFGIKSLGDLPKMKEFKTPDGSIGEHAPIEETVDKKENNAD